MRNPYMFIIIVVLVVVLEVLLLWGASSWVGRLLGVSRLPVWVCIVAILLCNIIVGKHYTRKRQKRP